MKSYRISKNITVLVWIFFVSLSAQSAQSAEKSVLKGVWNTLSTSSSSQSSRSLRAWTLEDLFSLAPISSHEKDPVSGQLAQWKGVLISKWIEKELSELPLEQRSEVDLLILKNQRGEQAILPRHVVKAFPVMLAWEKDRKTFSDKDQGFTVVLPWSSNSQKMMRGNLPWSAYQISGVSEVQLTSYQARFSNLLLKRRTDPAAVRGEKMVVENCVSCHASGRAPSLTELSPNASNLPQQVTQGHARGGGPKLNGRDLRAFISYLVQYQSENQSAANQQAKASNSPSGN